MNFLELIRDVIPEKCGVGKVYGAIAEDIFWEENKGKEPLYHQGNFESEGDMACRERMKALYLFYIPEDWGEYEHYLDLLEFVACYHRQDVHKDNWQSRIDYLVPRLSKEEVDFAKQAWWIP